MHFDEAAAIVHKMKSRVKMLGLEQAADILTQLELDLIDGLNKDTCTERQQKGATILNGAFVEVKAIFTKSRML